MGGGEGKVEKNWREGKERERGRERYREIDIMP